MKARATTEFWRCFDALPAEVQQRARAAYRIWRDNQQHPGLHFKRLQSTKPPIWSVRIGIGWRALAVQSGGDYVWFWIGSHAEYDRLTGRS